MKALLIAACLVGAMALAAAARPPSTPLTIRERSDGAVTIRMRDGSLVTATKTSTGMRVSFPGSARGDQLWTRTATGWSVTDLEATRAATAALWKPKAKPNAPPAKLR